MDVWYNVNTASALDFQITYYLVVWEGSSETTTHQTICS